MAEEFQESELIFPENAKTEENPNADWVFPSNLSCRSGKPKRKNKRNSIPLKIPEKLSGKSLVECVELDLFDEDNEGGELVPPHVIASRRISAGKIAFPMCTGNGRTLKGRDLSQVRNSILRMTGFLET
ncbi:Mesocentin like [Actinidia chinensis var. chinensis]|uniref:Mesocentin like n=1 Tax=Actinidia chinensis var. chinensis TaxID=1590841 RepID=A0A2R6QAD6_ACTCC|nr:Mesocentin like [Actinidia chinensis var. chinensis]